MKFIPNQPLLISHQFCLDSVMSTADDRCIKETYALEFEKAEETRKRFDETEQYIRDKIDSITGGVPVALMVLEIYKNGWYDKLIQLERA